VHQDAVSSLTNTISDDRAWSQAALPVKRDGPAIRCIRALRSANITACVL